MSRNMQLPTGLPAEIREQVLQPGNKRFTVAVPPNYTDGRPRPLVLALHYAGPVTPFYGRGILTGLVEPALRGLGAFIVAPDCTGPDWTHGQSEADVLALLDHVHVAYNLDPRRTLITGYSMGGNGTWHLAARHADRFAAAVVMAGWPPRDAATASWQIPIYVIHSRHDEVMPLLQTERVVRQLQAREVAIKLVELDGITHYETHRFIAPLRAAIPWIEQAWAERSRRRQSQHRE